MTVTETLLANNEAYVSSFSGPLPLPPSKHVAVLAEFKESIRAETGLRPPWAAEAFPDVEEDVRQSLARVNTSPFIPHRDSVRGFVFDVATGRLHEVTAG